MNIKADNVTIGNNNNIHRTCILGSKPFSYRDVFNEKGVVIGDDNNIHSFCTVDSGTFRQTRIGDNNIIDSYVKIAHDVSIGNNCEIDTHASILGEVDIGNNVRICTGAIIHPKVVIHDGAVIGANSYVRHDVDENCTVYGTPASVQENTKYSQRNK